MQARHSSFWSEAVALHGSATPRVMPRVLIFGALSTAIYLAFHNVPDLHVDVAPYEAAGAILTLLLLLRTNSGYDRWWEARKLWGGIVNQARNFAISALAYGPEDPEWRKQIVGWAAAFPHAARRSLRDERDVPEIAAILGDGAAAELAAADHMPSRVAYIMARLLRQATDRGDMDGFSFLQVDKERALLIDHIGACERILKTPLPKSYSIKIRRFVLLFLAALPFALLERVGWLTPVVTMLVAYPLLAIDEIGAQLQNPFAVERLSHLPLDEISANIERNVKNVAPAAAERNAERASPAFASQLDP
jgi:putative membrane protein